MTQKVLVTPESPSQTTQPGTQQVSGTKLLTGQLKSNHLYWPLILPPRAVPAAKPSPLLRSGLRPQPGPRPQPGDAEGSPGFLDPQWSPGPQGSKSSGRASVGSGLSQLLGSDRIGRLMKAGGGGGWDLGAVKTELAGRPAGEV